MRTDEHVFCRKCNTLKLHKSEYPDTYEKMFKEYSSKDSWGICEQKDDCVLSVESNMSILQEEIRKNILGDNGE